MSGPQSDPTAWLDEPAHGCATRDPEQDGKMDTPWVCEACGGKSWSEFTAKMHECGNTGTVYLESIPPSNKEPTCLDRAHFAVDGKRQEEYGSPLTNFSRAATLFDAYLKARPSGPITPEDVAWLNVLQKCARGMHTTTPDTLADVSGYMRCIELLEAERDRLREMEE